MLNSFARFGRKAIDFGKKVVSKASEVVVDTAKSVKTWLIGGTVGTVVSVVAEKASATGVTLPDIGVDPTDYVTTVGTSLGVVFAAVVALGLAFWLARKGISMLKGNVK